MFVPEHKVSTALGGATTLVRAKNYVWEGHGDDVIVRDEEILTGDDQLLVTLSFAAKSGADYSSTSWKVKQNTDHVIEVGAEDGGDGDYNDMTALIRYGAIVN
jgi:hypothetical protein